MKTKEIINKILMVILIAVIVLGVYSVYLDKKRAISPDTFCVKYGSLQHRLMYASDKPVALWIKRNGGELGPYFDYKFCED